MTTPDISTTNSPQTETGSERLIRLAAFAGFLLLSGLSVIAVVTVLIEFIRG